MSQSLTPINSTDRLSVVDALRGFAVLGILIMNIKIFSFPPAFEGLYVLQLEGLVNIITYWGLEFLFHGKFFTMFTFLFGLGMAVQMSRAIAKNSEKKFPLVYLRRLLLLLVIGFIHDVFIWHGAVLLWYPVMGVLLLLFRKLKPKTMLIMTFIFIMLSCSVSIAWYAFTRPAPAPQKQVQHASQKQEQQTMPNTVEKKAREKCNAVIKTYKEGSYSDIVKDLLGKVPMTLLRNLGIGWYVLGMFLLGVWSWRKGLYHDIETHGKLIKKIFLYSLIIGVVFTVVYMQQRIWGSDAPPSLWVTIVFVTIRWFGMAAMCIMYVSGFLLLYRKSLFKRFVKPIEAVGRMALTNYIFQNILGGIIFYNFGFKLIGETGPLANLLICFLIFAIQIPLSIWWVKRFTFGPVEWLWRSLTYWKRQPIAIKREVSLG